MTLSLDRRAFLKAAAAVAVAPGAQTRPQSRARMPVVVIGAGMAGLRTADRLLAEGVPVVVLEARERPGGRVLTVREPFSGGLHGEAGPIRIPSHHRRTLALVERFGLPLIPFAGGSGSALSCVRGARVPSDRIEQLGDILRLETAERGLTQGALLERYVGDVPATLRDPDVTSAPEWLGFDGVTWPAWLASRGASPGAVALMTLGGDSRELSALYVLRQYALLGEATLFKIQGGMDRLPAAMAAAVRPAVTYGAAVTRLDPAAQSVGVSYRRLGTTRTIAAASVVVTVPSPVLRRIASADQVLQARFDLLGSIPYFPAVRFLAETRRRTWLEEGLSGSARTDRPAEVWDCAYDAEGETGLLGATVGGELGRSFAMRSRAASLAIGQEILRDAFPTVAVRKTTAYRWAVDAWAGGAFAVFRPGQMIRIMPAAGRPVGRVYFAGEHTATWMGWTEGAIQSADRAVGELLS